MTAKQARELSGQHLQRDREYVDDRIREACGRWHYRVWVQNYQLENVEATKEYYRSKGFDVTDREGGSIREFLISWENEQNTP